MPAQASVAETAAVAARTVGLPEAWSVVGALAAQRWANAVAGVVDEHPDEVLIAEVAPLRTTYRPLPRVPSAGGFAGAVALVDRLCDPVLGVLPVVGSAGLPEGPVALARCGAAIGAGVTVDAARLDAVLRHVGLAAGFDTDHAQGVALRHLVYADLSGSTVDVHSYPASFRWTKALRSLGVTARTVVRKVGGLYVAETVASGRVLSWAVEVTAADAAAFAALGAAAAVQAGVPAPFVVTGAARRPEDAWQWPAGVAAESVLRAEAAALGVAAPEPVPSGVPGITVCPLPEPVRWEVAS